MAKRTTKDKQMSANLKKKGDRRNQGRCCICNRLISNGPRAQAHYEAHARGVN